MKADLTKLFPDRLRVENVNGWRSVWIKRDDGTEAVLGAGTSPVMAWRNAEYTVENNGLERIQELLRRSNG